MKNLLVDVSKYQGDINWPAVARSIDAAIIKATDGASYIDPAFERNYRNARASGLSVILYHFLRPGDGRRQARTFCGEVNGIRGTDKFLSRDEVLAGKGGIIGLAVDVEWSPDKATGDKDTWKHVSKDARLTTITEFLLEVERITGLRCILYTAKTWWDPMTEHATEFAGISFKDYHLYLADYVHHLPLPLPAAWSQWSLWQKSGTGHVPGIDATVDLDVLREGLTLADLTVRPSHSITPPITPPINPAPVALLHLQRVLYLTSPFMRGTDIRGVQDVLVKLGKLSANRVDDVWGPEMDRIVRAVQRGANLNSDGRLGPRTANYLNSLLAEKEKI
jgi:GH25 family lysozyme M1 (1,4-beta-N-acetylmuramidase)